MKEYMSFVTLDMWTLVFTWVNLFILYLLMKKFLFKPIKAMIDKREQEIKDIYQDADVSKVKAEELKQEYEEKLVSAKNEAQEVVESASRKAQLKSEEIIKDAQVKASNMIAKADVQIEARKKTALNEVKNDISEMAVSIASKVIEKDINENDYKVLVEKFIDDMGDVS